MKCSAGRQYRRQNGKSQFRTESTAVARYFVRSVLGIFVLGPGSQSLAAPPTASSAAVAAAAVPWAKGRILVMPRAGLADAELANILSIHGGHSIGKLGS